MQNAIALRVDKVSTYVGKTVLVNNATFDVKAGEIIGLIGPNGAGKTTIMKTILGLMKFKGKIEVNGKNVSENDHHALTTVGALIEHPAIYPFLTGKQNLTLYAQKQADMNNLIYELQMDSFINNKANGYSLGMKQKLGIAIALLNQPQIVILDEPMNGLDIESTIRVRKLIKRYSNQGTAFLISSHILSELQKVMTRVVLISGGQIILNKEVAEFEKISHQKYHLTTENNKLAKKIFAAYQITFTENENYLIVSQNDIYKIEDLLFNKGVHLKEMLPLEANLERIVVDVLEKKRG
ncbi:MULTISPECIES: ABC transporter ATP-binding protein [Lactobacillus]|uniref:ABC transporter ATP-binding protein n=1 Tax=Lactobacillus TaxID=1578 RepID=UPI00050D57ED|nr:MULTISPECIES: ABC transporter ATP-binding protein [Lactobacillus]AIS09248.1 ABC transporter ATP-binding protein [Lactobacillus sp. wkB8]UZX30700.1 ABC transporter ATP-binding protein [Lactobacillus helsingborgensis]